MPLIPLDIPAGIYRNGTDFQSNGRWRDANLVRWVDNTMRPMGGWRTRSSNAANAQIRGMKTWVTNNNLRFIAGGTYNKLYAWNETGVRYDITPTSFTAGRADAVAFTGFGGGLYGGYAYGVARPDTVRIQPATSWALDTWGEYLVGCTEDDGKLYEWQLNTSNPAAVIANAPTGNRSMVVTEERFLFALGAGGNPTPLTILARHMCMALSASVRLAAWLRMRRWRWLTLVPSGWGHTRFTVTREASYKRCQVTLLTMCLTI